MLLIFGGLSGAGKTTLGKYLRDYWNFRWIDLDGGPGANIVARLKASTQWHQFCAGNPAALLKHCPGQTVLTFPSFPIIQAPVYRDSTEVRIRYLTGPRQLCFSRANARAGINEKYWDLNNRDLLKYLETSCPNEWKVLVVTETNKARPVAELAAEVLTPS